MTFAEMTTDRRIGTYMEWACRCAAILIAIAYTKGYWLDLRIEAIKA